MRLAASWTSLSWLCGFGAERRLQFETAQGPVALDLSRPPLPCSRLMRACSRLFLGGGLLLRDVGLAGGASGFDFPALVYLRFFLLQLDDQAPRGRVELALADGDFRVRFDCRAFLLGWWR